MIKGITLDNLNQYLITEQGTVYSLLKNRYLKGLTKQEGYKAVYLKQDNNIAKWYYIHRLVALAYHPNPDNKPDVDHIDNDRANNHKDNVQWVTKKENIQLSYDRGRSNPTGKDHHNYGKPVKLSSKELMSQAKQGENHPKFKGYYTYEGITSTSLASLAKQIGTYPVALYRLFNKGLIEFSPK